MKFLACLLAALWFAPTLGAQKAPARRTPRPPVRVRLVPQFKVRQVFHYHLDLRRQAEGGSSGVVENPQAASKTEVSVSMILRFDVLGVVADRLRPDSPGSVRLRVKYERVAVTASADVYDPELAENEALLRKLEGRSLEFTVGANGQVVEVHGLEEIVPEGREVVRDWLAKLSFGVNHPGESIQLGQKWNSEQPLPSAPLAGLLWRTESTYLRNEPCRTVTAPSAAQETCAVILTRFELAQPRRPRDPTPEEYRQHGLRTAGTMSGTGESVSYVSLATGMVVSVTHTGTQDVDLVVSTLDGDSTLRQTSRVRRQLQITLMPEGSAAPQMAPPPTG